MIDYAYPAIMAERAMRDLHLAALNKDFDTAIDQGCVAIAEMRMTINALRDMKDKQDAIYQQTKTV